MNRFFCKSPQIVEDTLIITDRDKVSHIRKVLCLRPKEELVVFDSNGIEYHCIIESFAKGVTLRIKNKILSVKNIHQLSLSIACAIPKNAKFDDIVDKLTQLGADRIIPLISHRVVVKLDRSRAEERLKRWRKIAESASQQSQRNKVAVIEPVTKFDEIFKLDKGFDLKLIPTLTGLRKPLKEIISEVTCTHKVLVLIGPEGDFTEREVEIAKNSGFIPVSLGDLVLRVDTAAIAIAAALHLGTVLKTG